MTIVRLTWSELAIAACVGVERHVHNLRVKAQQAWGYDGAHAWETHIVGAQGEALVAKHFGCEWDGALGDYAAKDVGGYQVRTTRIKSGCLILHPEDLDDDLFVLVVLLRDGVGDLVGAKIGHRGKIAEFWRDPGTGRPCFMVPQSALGPIS